MANLTLRQVKGSPLTIAEMDGNFEYFTGSYTNTGIITAQGFSGSFTGSISGSNITSTGFIASSSGYIILSQISASLNFIDDVAAAAAGVPLGGLYRNGNFVLIRIS
jgi:hypothetical protein